MNFESHQINIFKEPKAITTKNKPGFKDIEIIMGEIKDREMKEFEKQEKDKRERAKREEIRKKKQLETKFSKNYSKV